ncbi:MAG TPA: sulfite exporter TauE/SafE family protein [Burkholderiales bacterium]|jgi:hypothetical protein
MESFINPVLNAPLTFLLAVTFAFTVAGLVKGVVGMGLPTVAIGLLGLVMTPAQAAAILVIPSLVTNVWQLAAGPRFGVLFKRLWPLLLCACLGTWSGMAAFEGINMSWATIALGVALIAYGLLGLMSVQFSVPPRHERWLGPVIGFTTGVVTAATGIFTVPGVPYLQALDLNRDDLIQALGLNFTVATIALAGGLAHAGVLKPGVAGFSLIAMITALIGMFIGTWLRTRISPTVFRRCFFGGLLILGCHLALRGLF